MKKIYLLAILFAILTGFAVFNFARSLQNAKQTDRGAVVVAVAKIPQNTLITQDMVALKKLSEESINPLAVHDLSQVVGRISNVAIEADEQVLSSKLNEQGTDKNGLAYSIPKGRRAVTIAVDDITGVAGNIQKSNRVDILAVVSIDKISTSFLLLQNIEVLKTNAVLSDKQSAGYTNLTLSVTPEEAEKLFYAQVNGKLTVALRPILDTNLSNIGPYVP